MNTNFDKIPILSCVNVQSLDNLRNQLKRASNHVLELNGKEIKDAASFFAEVKQKFPLDPPLQKGGWDAFSDSFWGGLDEIKKPQVAIIWVCSENIVEKALADFLTAIDCLLQVARDVATSAYGISIPVKVHIFLIGSGVSYKSFEG